MIPCPRKYAAAADPVLSGYAEGLDAAMRHAPIYILIGLVLVWLLW